MMRRLLSVLILPLVVGACSGKMAEVQAVKPDNTVGTDSKTNTDNLTDYCNFPGNPPTAGASQTDFDTYSWQMFISLNWVVSESERGQPNCSVPMATAGERVWESWKTTEQVFLPGAQNPGTWNSGWPTAGEIKLSAKSKVSPQAAADANSQQSTVLQPVGGWLIDQRGNPTYYQIASNETSYNYIVTNDLYNANTVATFSNVNFPWQAAEIKASWRILEAQDDASRYLTMTASVEQFGEQGNPLGTYVSATLGLVGLHIINKAPGFPQWIWATFEQIDNVDPEANFAPYYNASATNPNQSPCYNNAFPCKPAPGASFTTPDPLTRITAIQPSTATVNSTFQALFPDTFPKYYQLITTQRPNDPNNFSNPLGTPEPNISANVTMESYIQPTSSCMACHQTASGVGTLYRSDFSFLLLHAQEPSTASETDEKVYIHDLAHHAQDKKTIIEHQSIAGQ